MAISFASDSSNEFIIENGEFVLVKDGAEVAQNVREVLLSYLDDWFLDRTHGIPYFQTLFTKPFNIVQAESILKSAILRIAEVETLLTFSSSFTASNRVWSVQTSFRTIYDTVEGVTIND